MMDGHTPGDRVRRAVDKDQNPAIPVFGLECRNLWREYGGGEVAGGGELECFKKQDLLLEQPSALVASWTRVCFGGKLYLERSITVRGEDE